MGGYGFLFGVRAWLGVVLGSQGQAPKVLFLEDMFPGCCRPFECYYPGFPKAGTAVEGGAPGEGRHWRPWPTASVSGREVKEGCEVCSRTSVYLRRKCGWGVAAFLCVSEEVRFDANL